MSNFRAKLNVCTPINLCWKHFVSIEYQFIDLIDHFVNRWFFRLNLFFYKKNLLIRTRCWNDIFFFFFLHSFLSFWSLWLANCCLNFCLTLFSVVRIEKFFFYFFLLSKKKCVGEYSFVRGWRKRIFDGDLIIGIRLRLSFSGENECNLIWSDF